MEEENLRTDDDVILDLGGILDDYLRCVSRYWFQFLLLTLTVAALVLTYFNLSYTPSYSARVIYSVNKTGDTTVDAAITTRLSDAIATLTAENEFQEDLLSLIEPDTINRQYAFSSSYTSNVNLFSVTVTANNDENANLILDCFMKVYPAWASRSTGTVDLQAVDISYSYGTATNSYSVTRSVLIGIAIGLVACFAIAMVYVLTIQTVRRESDMRRVTTKSCIAMIPEIREKKRSESTRSSLLISNQHVDWGLKQSILLAQSRIEKLMTEKEQQVLLVTGTLPQEGKSMVSVNLALAFAQKGHRVILLDGDMRNPSVLKMIGQGEHAGLSDCLKRGEFMKEMVVRYGGMDILPSGTQSGAASELIVEGKMKALMKFLRRRYDIIVIDTPPSCGFADANILSEYADAVVYVVRHDTPTVGEVTEGIAPFISSNKLIGYLINRTPGGFSTYGKYGKYGRYGAYGYGYGKYGHYGKYGPSEAEENEAESGSAAKSGKAAAAGSTANGRKTAVAGSTANGRKQAASGAAANHENAAEPRKSVNSERDGEIVEPVNSDNLTETGDTIDVQSPSAPQNTEDTL